MEMNNSEVNDRETKAIDDRLTKLQILHSQMVENIDILAKELEKIEKEIENCEKID